MDNIEKSGSPVITKETKNRIHVDYEGKLTVKERLLKKLSASNTWIKVCINIVRFVLMLGVSFVIIYPFIAKIANSFMTLEDISDMTVALIPRNPTLDIYKAIITENRYFEALLNTVLLSLMCAVVQMLISCIVGYGIAKFKFKGNSIVMGLVVFTMVIPHGALELSMSSHLNNFDLFGIRVFETNGIFQLITGQPINLQNTFVPYLILSLGGLAFKNGLYIYLMRQFFKGVPDELEESAYVDGSGVFRTFFQIILPLAVPMMITVFLFAFSWQWTDEFYTRIFSGTSQDKLWLMPDVYITPDSINKLTEGSSFAGKYDKVVQNTGGLMIIAPLVILYLFCQKYLVQGIERSGLVG